MSRVELKDVEYFLALARHLHFGKAAETLHTTQPNLSRVIAALEAKLGYKLLERSTRNVRLTAAGEVYAHDSREAVVRLQAARESARAASQGSVHELSITLMPSAVFAAIPLIRKFSENHHDVRLRIQTGSTGDQLRLLLDKKTNIGFVRPPSGLDSLRRIIETYTPAMVAPDVHQNLKMVPIMSEPLVVVAPDDHRLAGRHMVSIADLEGEKMIALSSPTLDPVFQQQIDQLFVNAGVAASFTSSAGDTFAALALVASGNGLAVLPRWTMSIPIPNVVQVPLSDSHRLLEIVCTWSQADMSPQLAAFVAIIETAATAQPADNEIRPVPLL